MDKTEKLKARLKRRMALIEKHTNVLEAVRENIETCKPKQKKYWVGMENRQKRKIRMSLTFWKMLKTELSFSQPTSSEG